MMMIAQELARGAFNEVNFSFAPNLILGVAVELEIFPMMMQGGLTVSQIAAKSQCSEKGTQRILDCLAAMGCLDKNDERYELNTVARRYFLPSSEDYAGHLFAGCAQLLKYWLTLPQAVRDGTPTLCLFSDQENATYNLETVEALYQFHKKSAWELARILPHPVAPARILDVAAGSAVWSLPFAVRFPRVEVTAVDLAAVSAIGRKFARRLGVEARYHFVSGDIRALDFGEGDYDLAILGHICHSEGRQHSRDLIDKCFRALHQNGRLLITDYLPDDKRKTDLLALVLSVNALLGSEEGDTFTLAEYTNWLMEAGFKTVETLPLEGHYPCIVALKEQ